MSKCRGEVRLYWEFEEIESEILHATGMGGAGPIRLCDGHYEERRRRAERKRVEGVGHFLDVHPVPSNREMAEAFRQLKGADPETQAHLDEVIRTLSRGPPEDELERKLGAKSRVCHDGTKMHFGERDEG